MAKLKVYCCTLGGRDEGMVAATSRKVAAELMGLSVSELTTYGHDANEDDEKVAMAEPGVFFRKADPYAAEAKWQRAVSSS
ncbi:hypothetical protein EFK68_03605 [Pseudomonas aeruginosa]|nr:hypothetical protein EFK68_03605 [Pseudomonas aeruginosa]